MNKDMTKKKNVTYSLSDDAIRLLEEIAKHENRNRSNMLEFLIYKEAERQLSQ